MGMYKSTLLEAYRTKLRRGKARLSRQELVTCVVATFICFHDLYGLGRLFYSYSYGYSHFMSDGHLVFTVETLILFFSFNLLMKYLCHDSAA